MRLFITDPAKKDLKTLDLKTHKRIEDALEGFLIHPNQVDVRKLEGKKDYWRLRVGTYRVILWAQKDILYVMRVRHRREAYR